MIYTFSCDECGHHEEVWNVKMDERNDTRTCPECGKDSFNYDFALTMKGSRVAYKEDTITYLERRFAGSKTWRPPTSHNKGVAGKVSGKAGAGRHYVGDPRHSKREI